jgi:MFS family permease
VASWPQFGAQAGLLLANVAVLFFSWLSGDQFLVWGWRIAGCLLSFVITPLSGHISDRIGRKRVYLLGAIAMGIFGFIYFAMLNSLMPGLIFLGIMLSFAMHGILYGPQAALIAECFTPPLRYSGCSLGYHLAAVTGGGPAPLIATALLAWTGSGYAIAGYIAACAVVSVIATLLMPESHQSGHFARTRLTLTGPH